MAHRAAEDAGRAMSEEPHSAKEAARETLRYARDHSQWRMKNLNRNKKEIERTLLRLDAYRDTPEVADFLRRTRRNPGRVDSRELHYMQRSYRDGRPIPDLDAFDALFARVLNDPHAHVYRSHGVRYQVRSVREGWIAILDPDGTHVSLYPNLNDDFGEAL
ncbi:hypothetical protein Thivi_3153 [Thiocystis violascens DSM 198]|uniref:Uncharacterized protein n=2 Tax=Thiocystis violascens TaxID=73141 RepID=I3YDG2_THIV6|nr:hypothetical protein Thivi_3153 [Thiocystis violascens DSM 198]